MGKVQKGGRVQEYQGKTGDKENWQYRDRLVAEKKLGRSLKAGEVVHHKNGSMGDDRPANLEVMTRGQHNTKDKNCHKGGRKSGS